MPITQDRMLRLIEAGTEYLNNYQQIVHQVQETERFVKTELAEGREVSVVDELERILQIIKSLGPSIATTIAISEEKTHFNIRRRHNDKSRAHIHYTRARKAEQDEEREFEATAAVLDLEAATTPAIDLAEAHKQVLALGESPVNIRKVAAVIAHLGEPDQKAQAKIIGQMVEEGMLLPTEIGGEYTVESIGAGK